MTIFDGPILCYVILNKKSRFFINTYFHQTQPVRANRYYWTLPPLKNIVPYSICFASIIKAKWAFFNKTNEIISHNMHTVAMDTTPNPSTIFKGLLDSTTGRRRNNFRKTEYIPQCALTTCLMCTQGLRISTKCDNMAAWVASISNYAEIYRGTRAIYISHDCNGSHTLSPAKQHSQRLFFYIYQPIYHFDNELYHGVILKPFCFLTKILFVVSSCLLIPSYRNNLFS